MAKSRTVRQESLVVARGCRQLRMGWGVTASGCGVSLGGDKDDRVRS